MVLACISLQLSSCVIEVVKVIVVAKTKKITKA